MKANIQSTMQLATLLVMLKNAIWQFGHLCLGWSSSSLGWDGPVGLGGTGWQRANLGANLGGVDAAVDKPPGGYWLLISGSTPTLWTIVLASTL